MSATHAKAGLTQWKEDFALLEAVPQRDLLTAAELRSALEALRPIDLIRLRKKATALAPGTGMEPDDLLQEAVGRSLEEHGGRNCPRGVSPVIFLSNVIRSIASHAREEWAREMPVGATEDHENDPIVDAPDPAPSPEQAVIGRLDHGKTLSRIEAMFEDDPQAQAVVIGNMEGWSPDEIREMEPMSDKEYAAARKRVRRALLREYPKGPIYE